MSIIAIIPARAGSKGLPGKNTRMMNGKALVAYTIQAALDSQVFSKVLVTSDDPLVLAIAKNFGAFPIVRPLELSDDEVTMAAVVNHVLELEIAVGSMSFALLQPTSPLRNANDIRKCAGLFSSVKYQSAASVCLLNHPPQKSLLIEDGCLQPLTSWGHLNQNRQSLEMSYRQNGAMWFVRCSSFLKEQRFVIAPAAAYVMSEDVSIDIDTLEDFSNAEKTLGLIENLRD